MLRAIALLGREELHSAKSRGEVLEIRCEFCGERYRVTSDEIGALLPDS